MEILIICYMSHLGDVIQDYENKQMGFYTVNPLIWYDALQEYTNVYNIWNRYELKINKK